VIEFRVLQHPRRNRTISSQSSLRPDGLKTAIVQTAKNSDDFFSNPSLSSWPETDFEHLRDERNHAIVAGDIKFSL